MSWRDRSWSYRAAWAGIRLAISAATALAVTLLVVVQPGTGTSTLAITFLVALTFAWTIGVPAKIALERLVPRLRGSSAVVRWLLIISTLLGVTMLGALATQVILTALGIFSRAHFWVQWFANARLATLISLGFGVAYVLRRSVQARLEETTAQLRERELEKERALKLAAEAQLASLASRIHPHFLFNTLSSISELIREDPAQAERMVQRLATLLRFSLDANRNPLVPLQAELQLVSDYLEIERVRYGERLQYEFAIPDELTGIHIPPLSIQTLVENSVKYAVAPRREGGRIRIAARPTSNGVELQVWDDGPGFNSAAAIPGHGVDNLRARLAMLFGNKGDLQIAQPPRENGGLTTVVTLSVPT